MSTCRRCHRVLKREPWRSKGIGRICERKMQIDAERVKQNDDGCDEIVPYDGGDFWIERLNFSEGGCRTNVQRRVYKHSPTGFNFGYGGSGPADFALNLLMMVTNEHTAQRVYQDFKWRFVAGGKNDRLVIPRAAVIDFLNFLTISAQNEEEG